MVTELISRKDRQSARELIEGHGLNFEERFDNLFGVFVDGELAATAARDGNILKMFAIRAEFQNGPLLGELVTEILRFGFIAGQENFFVFTSPPVAASFQALNFLPLVRHPQVTLLEYGQGLTRYLEHHRELIHPGTNGAVVVNCNPFTLGHRYLIEQAAAQVETLYVFVAREDRALFPFEVRLRLVREGVRDLANVVVLESSHYAVSAVTFPAYFLKAADNPQTLQMEVDLMLFGKHLAPYFQIRRRFVGSEPYCRTTRLYNQAMLRTLPPLGVETVLIERRVLGEEAISAFRVREAIRREAYETVRRLVPATTLDFILSEAARPLRERMKTHTRRH
jgi:[citrate (pro-3S)-lyase] ligase